MRSFLMFLLIAAFSQGAIAQDNAAAQKNGAVITWEKQSHDFGDIYVGDKVEHTFTFKNTGNEHLFITNVQVSCGCTTPKGWPRDTIPSGQTGEISISFNSTGRVGKQYKPVTLMTNAVNREGNQISFTTNVLDEKRPK